MKTKYISKKAFLFWVLDQPSERKLDMSQDASSDEYGCLMVQFAKSALSVKDKFACGVIAIWNPCSNDDYVRLSNSIHKLLPGEWDKLLTFEDAKSVIRDKHPRVYLNWLKNRVRRISYSNQ